MAESQVRNPSDTSLGDYRLTSVLGSGGSSVVYRAVHATTGAVVALKVLSNVHPESLLRFKREFRIVADLDHPNLVRLLELVVDGADSYLTMEYIDGSSLDLLAGGGESDWPTVDPDSLSMNDQAPALSEAPRDLGPLCRVVLQVVDALESLHMRGILHRDLKPSNILVDAHGHVSLCDFGLACDESDADNCARVGTLSYMAPEQLRDEAICPAADRYALGGVLFRLLTGQHPVVGDVERASAAKRASEGLRPSRRVSGVPPLLDTLCVELLDPDPSARPGLAEVRSVLASFVEAPELRSHFAWRSPNVFVGRESELATCMEAVRQARHGTPSLTVISAPSGMGKSTLALRVCDHARRLGFATFGGRCYEREHVPYNGFDALVDEITTTLRSWSHAERSAIASDLHALRRSFPVLGIVTADLGDAPLDLDDVGPALARLLAALARKHPLVLVLDDLQWLSEDSDELLRHIAQTLEGRIAIFGSTRRTEGWLPAHDALLPGTTTGRHLALDVLDDAALRDVISDAIGTGPTEHELMAMVESATGSPLLAQRIALGWHTHQSSPDQPIRLDELVMRSLETLSPAEHHVLRVASVAGGEVDLRLVERIVALTRSHLELCLARLKTQRLIVGDTGRAGTIDVSHDQVRGVVYGQIEPEDARELHRTFAETIAAEHDPDPESLLEHWTAAGDVEARRRALLAAAESAESRNAPHRARELLRERLSEGEATPAERAEWLHRASMLSERLGDYAAAIDECRRALEITGHSDASLPRRARYATLLALAGRFEDADRAFSRVLADADVPLASHPVANLARVAFERARGWVPSSAVPRPLRVLTNRRRRPKRDLAEEHVIDILSRYGAMMLPYTPARAGEAAVRAMNRAAEIGRPELGRRDMPPEFLAVLGIAEHHVASPRDLEHDTAWAAYVEREKGLALMPFSARRAADHLERGCRIYHSQERAGTPEALVCHSALAVALGRAGDFDRYRRHIERLLTRGDFHSRIMGEVSLAAYAGAMGQAALAEQAADRFEAFGGPTAEPIARTLECYVRFAKGELRAFAAERADDLSRRVRWRPLVGREDISMLFVIACALLSLDGALSGEHRRALRRVSAAMAKGRLVYRRFFGHLGLATAARADGRRGIMLGHLEAARREMPTDEACYEQWFALWFMREVAGLSADDRARLDALNRRGFALPARLR